MSQTPLPPDAELRAALAETAALRGAVEELASATVASAAEATGRWRRTTALLVILLVLVGARSFVAVGDTRRFDRGIRCIAEQLAEHRVDNRQTHEALGEGHDIMLPPVGELPGPSSTEKILRICRPFINEGGR